MGEDTTLGQDRTGQGWARQDRVGQGRAGLGLRITRSLVILDSSW